MRILLDTHVWVWTTTASARISPTLRDAVEDGRNEIFVAAPRVSETEGRGFALGGRA